MGRLSFPTFLLTLLLILIVCSSASLFWSLGFFSSIITTQYSLCFNDNNISAAASDAIVPSLQSVSSKNNELDQPPPPLIAQRTLYTAGYDARIDVPSSQNPYVVWQWTRPTELYIQRLYDSVMNPQTCNTDPTRQGQHSIRLLKQPWGLGSRIRDTVDIMLAALQVNRTVLHAGDTTACPFLDKSYGNNQQQQQQSPSQEEVQQLPPQDPYMNCLYRTFSTCQGVSPVDTLVNVRRAWGLFNEVPRGVLVPNRRYSQLYVDAAVHKWWDDMVTQHGLHAMEYHYSSPPPQQTVVDQERDLATPAQKILVPNKISPPPEASLEDKYSVIRALMARHVFGPTKITPWVQQRVQELERQANIPVDDYNITAATAESTANPSQLLKPPTLVVHLRRTDKANDEARMYPHEQRPSIPETLVVIRALMRAAERLSSIQFRSIFFMSDEPQAFLPHHLEYLASTLVTQDQQQHNRRPPTVFYNDYVLKTLHNNTDYKTKGHEVFLNTHLHDVMDRELVASMTVAAKHGTYLVGYGRSGVSQLLAQLLGAKRRMDPSQLSLFEDDMVLLKNLEETEDWYWFITGGRR